MEMKKKNEIWRMGRGGRMQSMWKGRFGQMSARWRIKCVEIRIFALFAPGDPQSMSRVT